jgi:hypothetical protein
MTKKESTNNIFITVLTNLFGIFIAELIYKLIILIFVGILIGGIYLYKYIDDDIDKQPTRNILLGLSFFLIGISSVLLVIILIPYIITYGTIFLTFFGLGELVNTF